jgi:hypothetical protein
MSRSLVAEFNLTTHILLQLVNKKFVQQVRGAMSNFIAEGAFPPSHFCNKLADKLALKVALLSL